VSKFDLYQTVTDRIIELMEKHGSNWTNPFNKKGGAYYPKNPITGKEYNGVNVFLLGTTSFELPYWAGYGQWASRGCQVKGGEKATMIVYWKILEKKKLVDGVEKISKLPLLRYLNVFNIAQVEGAFADKLREKLATPSEAPAVSVNEIAEAFFAATGAKVEHSNQPRASYSWVTDSIHMPNRDLFSATATSTATEAYYGTLAHEVTHWTGHKSRLNRVIENRFASPEYAFEELVAELGSAMLSAQLSITVEPRADHAQYLNNWLACLKSDKGAIMKAASLAKAAAAFVSNLSEAEGVEEAA
jgi:antirestriction protein ArdC